MIEIGVCANKMSEKCKLINLSIDDKIRVIEKLATKFRKEVADSFGISYIKW